MSKKKRRAQYNSCQSFFIFNWNLNSVSAHKLINAFLPPTYIATNQCAILCLSEIFLDRSIFIFLSDDILGYNQVRVDHPANIKRGGVCIYFRKSLPLRMLNIHFLWNENWR